MGLNRLSEAEWLQPDPDLVARAQGFADWLEGDLRIDPDELVDARWFDVDDLPLAMGTYFELLAILEVTKGVRLCDEKKNANFRLN